MGNAMQSAHDAPRCGAYARTTGKPCAAPAMKNGRCRMHSGKATGRPITSGRYTKEADRKRREVRELLKTLRGMIG